MGNSVGNTIQTQVNHNAVIMYSKSTCGYCSKARQLLDEEGIKYVSIELDQTQNGQEIANGLYDITKSRFVPQIFICSKYIGGFDKLLNMHESGQLKDAITKCTSSSYNRYGNV